MTVYDITGYLDTLAPPSLQESYDNAGLLVGEGHTACTGVLVTLDVTEAVVQEAIDHGCNLIVAHHPIIFGGLKRLTGRTYAERVVMQALRHNIAIYAIHTNLDNVLDGVNRRIAERLGLVQMSILAPLSGRLKKLITFVPNNHVEPVRKALFAAGAGRIGLYDECSFNTEGLGTFRPLEGSNPYLGRHGVRQHEPEVRIEVILPAHTERTVLSALRQAHPYEEVAYDIVSLDNSWQEAGAGMVGMLPEPMEETAFLHWVRQQLPTGCIRHTPLLGKPISKVALCGGSGSFLLPDAIAAGAQVFLSADFTYHKFFDADGRIVIADIGHFESEQFTRDLLVERLKEKFANFAVRLSTIDTNPVQYLV